MEGEDRDETNESKAIADGTKKWKAETWNRYLHTHIHSSITHNSQKMGASQMSISKKMDMQNGVYTYHEVLSSLRTGGKF